MVHNGLPGPLYLVQVWLVQQQYTLGTAGRTTLINALIYSFIRRKIDGLQFGTVASILTNNLCGSASNEDIQRIGLRNGGWNTPADV